ncbi:hypothetical protein Sjap_014229 [Stephania japonica]|uniref:Uncharacterized protein n=1 Tax=Stephania japonica TaxID=461633 RepID=A0AAP0NYG1_9MAGN
MNRFAGNGAISGTNAATFSFSGSASMASFFNLNNVDSAALLALCCLIRTLLYSFASLLPSSTVNSYLGIFSASTRPNEIQSSPGVPMIKGDSFTSFCFLFAAAFKSSNSLCLSLLMSPSFSRSASRHRCFGVRYRIGVGASRQESAILLMRSAIAPPPPPPPPPPEGLAPLFMVIFDRFNGCPALSLALPFAVPLTEHLCRWFGD